jgi:hypothetical protein
MVEIKYFILAILLFYIVDSLFYFVNILNFECLFENINLDMKDIYKNKKLIESQTGSLENHLNGGLRCKMTWFSPYNN